LNVKTVSFYRNGADTPTLGFKSLKSAYATIKGFEVMRMFKKGQMDLWKYGQGLKGEIRLVNQQFDIYTA
jgi:IS6 family transposase